MKKYLLLFLVLLSILVFAVLRWRDRLTVVFCDIGQGDGFVVLYKNVQIVVDGGPNAEKLSVCLDKRIAPWDREIELVVNTHPEFDHYNGQVILFERYRVLNFMTLGFEVDNDSYKRMIENALKNDVRILLPKVGDKLSFGKLKITVLGPNGGIGNKNFSVKYEGEDNINELSVILSFSYGLFDMFAGGDIGKETELALTSSPLLGNFEVLKVSHHGSKYSSDETFLRRVDPELLVIQVGKNNTHGHPTNEVLTLFDTLRYRYLRTDNNGEIEIISDGKSFGYKSER